MYTTVNIKNSTFLNQQSSEIQSLVNSSNLSSFLIQTASSTEQLTQANSFSTHKSEFSPVFIGLHLKKIDSNTQSDITFPGNYLEQVDFSNAQATYLMLPETTVKDEPEVKKKETPPLLWQIQQHSSSIEWVRLTSNRVILATPEQVWVYRPKSESNSNFFAQPSVNSGNTATTKKLLDTAIVLAKRDANSSHKPSALTKLTWVWSLISQYHLTHFTPQLMEQASRYFSNGGQKHLAQWAAQKAIEESGHDRLALLDIQSLGYKAEAVVQAFVPPSAAALLDYFINSVQVSDPIKCVGYSYTLERLALAIDKEHIQAVEAKMPSNTKATRCLRVHSSIGSDVEHVEEIIEVMTKLTPEDRTKIALACYETALLYFSSVEGDYPSEQELEQKLQAFEY